VIAQAEQQVIRYAFRESLTANLAFLQMPAKEALRRGYVRHQDRRRPPTIKSFLSSAGI
jgi:hypothetical protein